MHSQEFFHEVGAHAFFPMKLHYELPTGYDPMNQTHWKGKIPQGPIPMKIPRQSCESKEASTSRYECSCEQISPCFENIQGNKMKTCARVF